MYASTTMRRASSHGVSACPSRPGRSGRSARAGRAREAGLEAVVPLRDVVAGRRRLDERLDRLVCRLVRQVAGRDPGRVRAQPVVDRLVLQDRVEDEGPRPEPGREGLGDRLGGRAACVAIDVVEARHRRLERQLVAVERDAERPELLLVEPRPRRDTGDGLLRDDPLLGLGEEIGPELPERAEVVAPVVERRIGEERSATSSGAAAHSSAKKRSCVSSAAAFSPSRATSAPRVGSAMFVANTRCA